MKLDYQGGKCVVKDKQDKVERKNFSFYMPDDFAEKLDKLQTKKDSLKPLSRSQAVYFIISQMLEDLD